MLLLYIVCYGQKHSKIVHNCSEILLWVCDLFYGFDRKMSYKDIPESFQPLSIANNRYTFSDGVYSYESDRLLKIDALSTNAEFNETLILIAEDDTSTGAQPPSYVNGVRRVRNVCVDVDFVVLCPAPNTFVAVSWIVEIVVIRQGQTRVFPNDILASRCGISRASTDNSLAFTNVKDDEEFSLCYPGYVDLCGGDRVGVRVSGRDNRGTEFFYCLGIGASSLIRFG